MFGRLRRAAHRREHDAESRARALEIVERLAEESERAPREVERHRLSGAAMDRQRISSGDPTGRDRGPRRR